MFKKIHSDRDPRDTVLSELRKEFRPYLARAGQGLKGIARSHPKFLFVMMVMNILLSAILCFTVFRHKEPPPLKSVTPRFDHIITLNTALRQTIRIKQKVDSLSRKKKLSSADSAVLLQDLDSLNHLNIKP